MEAHWLDEVDEVDIDDPDMDDLPCDVCGAFCTSLAECAELADEA